MVILERLISLSVLKTYSVRLQFTTSGGESSLTSRIRSNGNMILNHTKLGFIRARSPREVGERKRGVDGGADPDVQKGDRRKKPGEVR